MVDIPEGTTSTATFIGTPLFGSFSGELEQIYDEDAVRIDLQAGETVTFFAHVQASGTYGDSSLALLDSNGNVVASNDNAPGGTLNFNSLLTFTATNAGPYYLRVSDSLGHNGSYTLGFSKATALVNTFLSYGNDNYSGAAGQRIFGGYGADVITMNGAAEAHGEQGDDQIYGTAANELMTGGEGHDYFAAGGGSDVLFGDAGNDRLRGGEGIDTILGGAGDDLLWGENGADVMRGGAGNDIYEFVEAVDTISDESGNDTFTVVGGTFSLAAYASIENIRSEGYQAAVLTGNGLANLVIGANGHADTLSGGSGGSDTLRGMGGNDVLKAWSGADIFDGGDDLDTISFEGWNAGVALNLAATAAQAVSGGSVRLISVENATGGKGNDALTGSSIANILHGGAGGNDTLSGGLGNDILRAWSGADILNGGGDVDQISFEGWGSGVSIDLGLSTVQAVVGGSVRLSSIEQAQGGGGNDTFRATGAAAANYFAGGDGNDTFFAWLGSDVFDGQGGTGDTVSFSGWNSAVTISLTAASAQLVSGGSVTLSGIENVTGGNGGDTLIGSADANTIVGGAGKETMFGLGAADVFKFLALADSSLTTGQHDVITDFVSGIDKIDLAAIDAIPGGADQQFAFLAGNNPSFTAAGQVRYRQSGGDTFVEANTDADAAAELIIQLTGTKTLSSGDFVL